MQNDENDEKEPSEMTSDELLDYGLEPRVARKVRELAHIDDDEDDEC